ncbi:hypothetical protein [Actinomadura algeriensis]|uniref:Uncharacterized protein n=1 Tax=Actinomadura algeriensis TaxID=1679523 RepID=A0ABR9JPJ0_9ACTN|nr:hypothetical protein [Actinomadura algeriensis]MBE1532457.1 hypothetical protein [Actinomadura algeriensis]
MTAPAFAVAYVDPEEIVAALQREIPGLTAWWGEFTGSFWALLDGRLCEFRTPQELVVVARLAARPRPQVAVPRAERPAPGRAGPSPRVPSGPARHVRAPSPGWRRRVWRAVQRFFVAQRGARRPVDERSRF